MSSEELNAVLLKSEMWRGAHGDRRVVVMTTETEHDSFDEAWVNERKRFTVYDVSASGKRSVFRQFTKDRRGVILEVFENLKQTREHKSIFGTSDDEGEDKDKKKGGTVALKEGSAKLAVEENAAVPSVAVLAAQQLDRELNELSKPAEMKVSPRAPAAGSGAGAGVGGSVRNLIGRSNKVAPAVAAATSQDEVAPVGASTAVVSAMHGGDAPNPSSKDSPRGGLDHFFREGSSSRMGGGSNRNLNGSNSNSRNNSNRNLDASFGSGSIAAGAGGGSTKSASGRGRSGKAGPSSNFSDGIM